jgi:hypothetical protein
MQKAYINVGNVATIVCPRCGKSSEIDATPYLHSPKAAQITFKFKCSACDCGHTSCRECKENNCRYGNSNVIQLERRKYFRKKVNLSGVLFDREEKKHQIHLLDLSRTGVKMSMLTTRPVAEGQQFTIEFTLDDAKSSLIAKEIIIRKIVDKTVTGEFINTRNYDVDDKIIGFYLMK